MALGIDRRRFTDTTLRSLTAVSLVAAPLGHKGEKALPASPFVDPPQVRDSNTHKPTQPTPSTSIFAQFATPHEDERKIDPPKEVDGQTGKSRRRVDAFLNGQRGAQSAESTFDSKNGTARDADFEEEEGKENEEDKKPKQENPLSISITEAIARRIRAELNRPKTNRIIGPGWQGRRRRGISRTRIYQEAFELADEGLSPTEEIPTKTDDLARTGTRVHREIKAIARSAREAHTRNRRQKRRDKRRRAEAWRLDMLHEPEILFDKRFEELQRDQRESALVKFPEEEERRPQGSDVKRLIAQRRNQMIGGALTAEEMERKSLTVDTDLKKIMLESRERLDRQAIGATLGEDALQKLLEIVEKKLSGFASLAQWINEEKDREHRQEINAEFTPFTEHERFHFG